VQCIYIRTHSLKKSVLDVQGLIIAPFLAIIWSYYVSNEQLVRGAHFST
jgi:hypothetical protein